jgi:photosynthetic reaction center H subunit
MIRAAFTSNIDVAQAVLYAFFAFFAALIYYLRREDHREGYPLEEEEPRVGQAKEFFFMPPPKTFRLAGGGHVKAPREEVDTRTLKAVRTAVWPGSPLAPVGDPMQAEIGPGAYALRADVPEKTHDGRDLIVPLRVASNFAVAAESRNPVGMKVFGADGKLGGVVTDVWVDRGECVLRYYEIDADGRRVLLPVNFARVDGLRRTIRVQAILGAHFAGVPTTRDANAITLLEEEKVTAYYGAGTLYATPQRAEPLL